MKSGAYWEYWCTCGIISEYIGFNETPEQTAAAKKRLEARVKEHNKKYHSTK